MRDVDYLDSSNVLLSSLVGSLLGNDGNGRIRWIGYGYGVCLRTANRVQYLKKLETKHSAR